MNVRLFSQKSSFPFLEAPLLFRVEDGTEHPIKVIEVSQSNGFLRLSFAQCLDRTTAERFRKALLCGRREDFPPPEPGEFYACDLHGARVLSREAGDAFVGHVEGSYSYPSVDVLVVRTEGGELCEFPLVSQWLERIDPQEKVVVVSVWPLPVEEVSPCAL